MVRDTYNFREEDYNYEVSPKFQNIKTIVDTRNGFKCHRPTMDIDCLINYIELLNSYRDKWKSFGYLDLGMIPLLMAPSFMQSPYLPIIRNLAAKVNLQYYVMPAVSLMYSKCTIPEKDLWVFRDDAARLLNKDPLKISTVDIYKEVFYDSLKF